MRAQYDMDAEQIVLGGVLRNMDLAYDNIILPEDFYDPLHQRIAETFNEIQMNIGYITPKTVAGYMCDDRGLHATGGETYLAALKAASTSLDDFRGALAKLRALKSGYSIGENP